MRNVPERSDRREHVELPQPVEPLDRPPRRGQREQDPLELPGEALRRKRREIEGTAECSERVVGCSFEQRCESRDAQHTQRRAEGRRVITCAR